MQLAASSGISAWLVAAQSPKPNGIPIDVIALVLSAASLVFALTAFFWKRRDRSSEKLFDLYFLWISVDEQQCRRLVYESREAGARYSELPQPKQNQINHAVGTANYFAFQYRLGKLPCQQFLELFTRGLPRLHDAASDIGYFSWQLERTGGLPWAALREFAETHRQQSVEVDQQSGN